MSVGVIIGRFQVDELHPGHRDLIQYVGNRHGQILIFLGYSPSPPNQRDPLDITTRMQSIWSSGVLPKEKMAIIVQPICDHPSDAKWSVEVDRAIESLFPIQSATIYTGRDGIKETYSGKFPVETVEETIPIGSTSIRKEIAQYPISSRDFRRGVIYAMHHLPPRNYQTVDIACLKWVEGRRYVLLGRKKDATEWRFPGGFVDKGERLEDAAARELREETGIWAEHGMDYCGSFVIEDWRTRGHEDVSTVTALFSTEYFSGRAEAADDLAEVEWYMLAPSFEKCITPDHRQLWKRLIEIEEKKNKRAQAKDSAPGFTIGGKDGSAAV